MSENKDSILILFKERKKETPNSFFYERKFSREYNTIIIFISDYLSQSNHKIAESINQIIKEKNISLVLFEGDHISIFDTNFIQLIDSSVKKGLFLQDDYMYHYINRITVSACDFVFTACPLSDLKFKELGYRSFFLPVESDGLIFKDYSEKKIYDVLFFGRVKNNREEITKYLKENGIKVMECGPYDSISDTPEKLARLIGQSKIVLNFTESDNTSKENNPLSHLKYYYQMKGRVCFTGLCGSLCVSEYSPSNELLFDNNEIPYFKGKEDCLNIIKSFLVDNSKLIEATKKYKDKCLKYEDSTYIKKIKNFIDENAKERDKIKPNIPYWYELVFFKKNIMLRFRLNRFLSFFKQVFDSIFLVKYRSKFLLPIFLLLGILTSILFIIKFPLAKLKS
tara:strand:- start:787 stop:1974 length:1188 start_codon:yes stop_codon:yes gene_type:complete